MLEIVAKRAALRPSDLSSPSHSNDSDVSPFYRVLLILITFILIIILIACYIYYHYYSNLHYSQPMEL